MRIENEFLVYIQGYPQRMRLWRRLDCLEFSLSGDYLMIWKIKKEVFFPVSGNHENDETDSVNSVKSSFKSHPLWLTLYIKYPNIVLISVIINDYYRKIYRLIIFELNLNFVQFLLNTSSFMHLFYLWVLELQNMELKHSYKFYIF